jgi:hypothetical protein
MWRASSRSFICNRSASSEPREGIKAGVAIQAAVRQYANHSQEISFNTSMPVGARRLQAPTVRASSLVERMHLPLPPYADTLTTAIYNESFWKSVQF